MADAMRFLAAVDATPEATPVEAHHGGEVVLLELELKRQADVRTCLAHVLTDAVRARAVRELDARVSEDGVLHLRFDKQAAALGDVRSGDGADTVQVRVKPEVHPASRDGALAALQARLAS